MKTAANRSVRSRKGAVDASRATAPSAYGRLAPGEMVNVRRGPRESLLRLTLIRGYGEANGAGRFDALEEIRERLQLDDRRVHAVYSTLCLHVDAAIDRRLLQPLAAERDGQRRSLTRSLTAFTDWYRGHLSAPRSDGQQLLPESLLLQALDTLRSALEQDPLMSRPIDPRFKRTTPRQRRQETERARQALCAWGIGKRHADEILKCVGLSEHRR